MKKLFCAPGARHGRAASTTARLLLTVLMSLALSCRLPAAPNADFWKIATPQELPFEEQIISQKEEGGLVWKEFYFTSEVFKGEKHRIYALYAAPKAARKAPAILFLHGGGGTADAVAVKYWATHGYACLSFDWSANPKDKNFNRPHSSRFGAATESESAKSQFVSPPQESRTYHALIAARRAISWLQQQAEVDAGAIGVEGVSWGGFYSLILGGIDERVKAVVTVYGAGFFTEFGVNGGAFGVTGPLQGLPREQQKEWLEHFDPQHYIARLKAPLFLMTGTNDSFFWLPLVMRTYEALPGEKRLWLEPNNNHHLHYPDSTGMDRAALRWFDLRLRGQGAALPEIAGVTVAGARVSFAVSPPAATVATAALHFLRLKEKPKPAGWGLAAYIAKEALWETVPAQRDAKGLWQAALPAAPAEMRWVALYASIETADGITLSSPVREIEVTPALATVGSVAPLPAQAGAPAKATEGNLFVDPSFEAAAPKRGKSGELYINMVGAPKWDNTGDKARTGKAALGLSATNSLAIGAPAAGGKAYRLRGYFRAEAAGGKARLQINWKRADNSRIKLELKMPELSTAYQEFEIVATAPPDTASATLFFFGASGEATVWLDDVFFGAAEVAPDGAATQTAPAAVAPQQTAMTDKNPYWPMANRSVAAVLALSDEQLSQKNRATNLFWLAWGYTAPQSKSLGKAEVLEKCVRLWDDIAARYTAQQKPDDFKGGFWDHLPLLESLRYLESVDAIDATKKAAWKAALRPQIEEDYREYGHATAHDWATVAAKHYPNADAQHLAVMYLAYLVYGDEKFKTNAQEFTRAMEKHLRPPGAWEYYLGSTPIPLYHGFEIMFLGRYHQLSRDPLAAAMIRRTVDYYPYTYVPENTVEYSSAPWWKQMWDPTGGPYHAPEIVAVLTGDGRNRWFADLRSKTYSQY